MHMFDLTWHTKTSTLSRLCICGDKWQDWRHVFLLLRTNLVGKDFFFCCSSLFGLRARFQRLTAPRLICLLLQSDRSERMITLNAYMQYICMIIRHQICEWCDYVTTIYCLLNMCNIHSHSRIFIYGTRKRARSGGRVVATFCKYLYHFERPIAFGVAKLSKSLYWSVHMFMQIRMFMAMWWWAADSSETMTFHSSLRRKCLFMMLLRGRRGWRCLIWIISKNKSWVYSIHLQILYKHVFEKYAMENSCRMRS